MVFSSITFLYYFLPILILVYYIVPSKLRNITMLIFSLAFYFYGEPKYVLLLVASFTLNYLFAKMIYKNKSKTYLMIGVIINILILVYFKYTNFLIFNVNQIFKLSINFLDIVMPIGISFFTFQEVSYLIDVYKERVTPSSSLLNYATYVCLFPQLVAGPIVRYSQINEQLKSREHSFNNFSVGVTRFVLGLSKKVILANLLGTMYDELSTITQYTVLLFWLKAIGYTLQLYLDFSAYSDMAIGLGHMFGFSFTENFNYPLIANSITDFWRRWHITLSSFFKDYVYIPLGGNRVSFVKWLRNIFVVWFLTGLWHGASWNYILWGLYFALLLLIEKKVLKKRLEKHRVLSHVYTLFLVIISFVIFKNESIVELKKNLIGMFNFVNYKLFDSTVLYYLKSYAILVLVSVLASTPLLKNIAIKLSKRKVLKNFSIILEPALIIILLVISTSSLISSTYNPFLYFRF